MDRGQFDPELVSLLLYSHNLVLSPPLDSGALVDVEVVLKALMISALKVVEVVEDGSS